MREHPSPALVVAVVLLAAVVYFPALGGSFISDDKVLIAGNPSLQSPGDSLSAFTRSYWHGLKNVTPYYRPLPVLSYAIDRALAGESTTLFHLTNLALHALNAVLAAWLAGGLLVAAGRGALTHPQVRHAMLAAGALVAVHPLHSEPAAAIFGRPDLMAAAGVLLFLNLALRGRPVAALASLAMALLSKESALLVPLLAPLALAGRPARLRGFLGGLLGGGALGVAYLSLRYSALGSLLDPGAVTRIDNPMVTGGPLVRWLTPPAVLARNALLWLWPSNLCGDRGFDATPVAGGFSDGWVLAGLLIMAGVVAALAAAWRAESPWLLPAAACVLVWLPGSSLLILSPVLRAERLLYLPSIFACVLAAGLFERLTGGAPGRVGLRRALPALALIVVVLMGARTMLRATEFTSDLAFHGADAVNCPSSAKAHYNFGNALAREGREEEAAEEFRRAGTIAPWLGIAHANRGASLLALGRLDEAGEAYRRALQENGSLVTARASLSAILLVQGRLNEALREAEAALELDLSVEDEAQVRRLAGRIREQMGAAAPGAVP